MDALQTIVEEARLGFAQARTPAEVENVKAAYLGKSGAITACMQGLGALPLEERKRRGASINEAKRTIEQCLQDRRQALAQQALDERLRVEALDVTLPGRTRQLGGLHPVSRTIERIEAYFSALGFDVAQGPEIETDWFNFTALNTPPDHPARSMHDTFYVEGGAGPQPCLLRTHTSPIQIRHAMQHVRRYALPNGHASPHSEPSPSLYGGPMPDIRVIAPGRTYRVDSDATHSPMFHQCEGLWIGDNVSFKDLRYTFTHFCKTFFESENVALRFRPSFFPFTEPSAEIDIRFPDGPLAGRWLEVAGAGQVHPNVVRNMGLDPERYIGFAFGIGPDRLTMLRYGINDLRLFFDADLRFLAQFR